MFMHTQYPPHCRGEACYTAIEGEEIVRSSLLENLFTGAVCGTMGWHLDRGIPCFQMAPPLDLIHVKRQGAGWVVVFESHHLINHPRQWDVGQEMPSGAFIMETSANITVVACEPHFLNVGILVVFLEEE